MNRRDFLVGLGAVLGWSAAARAQQKAIPVIAYVGLTSPGPAASIVTAIRQGLGDTGYVEGQNVFIEYRWAEGHYDRLPALLAELVAAKVDVIVAGGGATRGGGAERETLHFPH